MTVLDPGPTTEQCPIPTTNDDATNHVRVRLAASALAAAGVLFIVYPSLRPYHDETTVDGATASMSSNAWIIAHLAAMVGFILIPLGLLGVWSRLRHTGSDRPAFVALMSSWCGAGLTLPYYGAEDFALHAAAARHASGLIDLVNAIRNQPVALTTFGLGLTLLTVGAVFAAVAIWRARVMSRLAAVTYALAFALFIPQFYAPAGVRAAHGLLLGGALLGLAISLGRSSTRRP